MSIVLETMLWWQQLLQCYIPLIDIEKLSLNCSHRSFWSRNDRNLTIGWNHSMSLFYFMYFIAASGKQVLKSSLRQLLVKWHKSVCLISIPDNR